MKYATNHSNGRKCLRERLRYVCANGCNPGLKVEIDSKEGASKKMCLPYGWGIFNEPIPITCTITHIVSQEQKRDALSITLHPLDGLIWMEDYDKYRRTPCIRSSPEIKAHLLRHCARNVNNPQLQINSFYLPNIESPLH